MATLYISVWTNAAAVALGDPLQETSVNIDVTSTQSAAIVGSGRKRRRVRLFADADCFAAWGEDPTALTDGTDGLPLGASNPEYFDIEAGHKIAVISRT